MDCLAHPWASPYRLRYARAKSLQAIWSNTFSSYALTYLYSGFSSRLKFGWGGWIRTTVWLDQNQLPYRLATPQLLQKSAVSLPPGRKDYSGFPAQQWFLYRGNLQIGRTTVWLDQTGRRFRPCYITAKSVSTGGSPPQ
jgi:hypothetical protein